MDVLSYFSISTLRWETAWRDHSKYEAAEWLRVYRGAGPASCATASRQAADEAEAVFISSCFFLTWKMCSSECSSTNPSCPEF